MKDTLKTGLEIGIVIENKGNNEYLRDFCQ